MPAAAPYHSDTPRSSLTTSGRHSDPPLPQRDQNGNLRLLVVGNTGAGKSTVTDQLAGMLCIPTIHLDELRWRANWAETPDDQFREAVASFIRRNDSWIIDGNARKLVGDLTTSNATSVIWLDPPFALYFPRLLLRTFLRLLRLNAPCSPGCNERLSEVFSWGEKSVLWWSWTGHRPKRLFYAEEMKNAERDNGTQWIRIGGWGGELRRWVDRVKDWGKGQ